MNLLKLKNIPMTNNINEKMVVNIYGLPGVGKSTLRNALVEIFGKENCGKIPGDHYLKAKHPGVTFFQYFTQDNYDWELLARHIDDSLVNSISPPLFDFSKFIRISENGYEKKFTITRLNFLDTAAPCPFADFHILIALGSEERKQRIIQRGGEDYFWKKFVLNNWKKMELLDSKREKLYRAKANLILNGLDSVENNANKISNLVKQQMSTISI